MTCNELIIVNTDSTNGYLFSEIITASGGLTSLSDVSMNNRLFVGGDISLNSRLSIASDCSINGNLFTNNFMKINRITEYITPVTITTNAVTIPFTGNSTLYYTTTSGVTANFTVNFTGVPTDPNQSFVCTLLINTGTTRYYANVVQIGGVGKTLLCNGGISNVSLGTCTFVSQSFVFVNAGATAPIAVLTNVVPYQ